MRGSVFLLVVVLCTPYRGTTTACYICEVAFIRGSSVRTELGSFEKKKNFPSVSAPYSFPIELFEGYNPNLKTV